jgi:hypothetical protein
MNRSEISLLLGAIAARDQRTIGETDVLAWHEDLGDLDYADARQAVTRHFRESTERIMPAHIRRLGRIIRDERRAHETVKALPPGKFDDDPDRDERLARNIAKVRELLDEMTAKRSVPDDDGPLSASEGIHTRAALRARRERGHIQQPAPAKPKRDAKPADAPEPVDEQVSTLAKHYLREGWEPDRVADRLGVSRKWCRKQSRRLAPLGPVGWCGKCTYASRTLPGGNPCPDCHQDQPAAESTEVS